MALTLKARYPDADFVHVDVDAVIIDSDIWLDDCGTLSNFIDVYDLLDYREEDLASCEVEDLKLIESWRTSGYPYPIQLRRGE